MFNHLFFKCKDKDCGFVFTTLGADGEEEVEVEVCPVCQDSIDYAPKGDREAFVKNLIDRLPFA